MAAKVSKSTEERAIELFNQEYANREMPGREPHKQSWREAPGYVRQHYRKMAKQQRRDALR